MHPHRQGTSKVWKFDWSEILWVGIVEHARMVVGVQKARAERAAGQLVAGFSADGSSFAAVHP